MFFEENPIPQVNYKKASELTDKLLITQYQSSPILREYFQAFVDELDLLMAETEKVYLGRFIEYAEGRQLDIIGIILGEERGVDLPIGFFGFSDLDTGLNLVNAQNLADQGTPTDGGVFRSEGQGSSSTTALSDMVYRRLLLAKAFLLTKDSMNLNNIYFVSSILMGKTPQHMKVLISSDRVVTLELSSEGTTDADLALIRYFSKYFIPNGTSFSINEVLAPVGIGIDLSNYSINSDGSHDFDYPSGDKP
tara:strand:- start:31 stop:780 length:750 start_codon:yes stop_codon:yes gene_type:complete